VIRKASSKVIVGTACHGCSVEVYVATNEVDDQGHGEGRTFVGAAVAGTEGRWTLKPAVGTLQRGQWLTATATTPATPGPAETSEFAANMLVR
jgi:hypothetical protein